MPDETRPLAPERYVFVYGTLRRGGSNDITRLRPAPRLVGPARVPGALYTLGPYPGMRLQGHADGDPPVTGEVYAIAPELEPLLDAIEGLQAGRAPGDEDEYARREIDVSVQGRTLRCVMYEIHPRFAVAHARLAHGDWFQCVAGVAPFGACDPIV